MEQLKLKIRDKRQKGWFYLDNDYLNGYARVLGISATGVYLSLCRHADNNQFCFPSQKLIADELAISERTVRTAIKSLADYKIIAINGEKIGGKLLNNT